MKAKTIVRFVARALPVGALFLPLGTITIKFLVEKATPYNIAGFIKMLFEDGNELFFNMLTSEIMDSARPWMYVAAAGLAAGVLAALAGLALAYWDSIKALAISAWAYAGGVLGAAAMAVGFTIFGTTMAGALMNIASTSVNYGTYILLGLLLCNLIHSLIQRRDAREAARRAALAAKKRKRR